MKATLVVPSYQPTIAVMLDRILNETPNIRIMMDQRVKERRVQPIISMVMSERTRRRFDRRTGVLAFKGFISDEQ